jgi:hypothetical protein
MRVINYNEYTTNMCFCIQFEQNKCVCARIGLSDSKHAYAVISSKRG